MAAALVSVHKLGGSILADAASVQRTVQALHGVAAPPALLVVSACFGVTDRLLAIGERAATGDGQGAQEQLQELLAWHSEQARTLLPPESAERVIVSLREHVSEAVRLCYGIAYLREFTPRTRDALLGVGELLASRLVAEVLRRTVDAPVLWVDAREYMVTDATFGCARPQLPELRRRVEERGIAAAARSGAFIVTQGFIGATPEGIPTTLGRGGSDLSAALFAVALGAEEVCIWKDVSGVFTADPDVVPDAELVSELSAAEMRALSLAGATVLHPDSVEPAIAHGITVRVRGVQTPTEPGTLIRAHRNSIPAPVAMAWQQPCWVYHVPEPVPLGETATVALALLSTAGELVVTRTPAEDAGRLGWVSWESPHVLVSVIGPEPAYWAVPMLAQLREAGHLPVAWCLEPPWALRVLVPHSNWAEAVRCLHRELLRWRRYSTVG